MPLLQSCLLLLGLLSGAVASAAPKPNVLFIVVDDLNWRLGCYGNAIAQTPNLDRLAKTSVRFERAYCNYPVCGASRTSFLSGRYPSTTGVLANPVDPRSIMGQAYRFLPEYFRDHGYYSAGVGKIPHTPDHIGSMKWDFHRDPEWEPVPAFKGIGNISESQTWADDRHPDGISARLAVELLETKRDQPLFLAVGFHRPHAPRAAPQKYWDQLNPELIPLPRAGQITAGIPEIAYPPKLDPILPESKIRSTLHGYYVTTAFVDAQVGLLLDALDRNDLWNDTIVVFFSDHGVHLGEHGGFWSKMSLMEESLKVPLLIHVPSGLSGTATSEPVELIDLFPTLTELCGLPPQEGVEGESLAPLLNDPAGSREKSAVFSLVRRGDKENLWGYGIRTKRWGYTEWPDGSRQLYDHRQDPGELHNLALSPEQAPLLERMASLLERHRAQHPLPTANQDTKPTQQPQAAAPSVDLADRLPIYRKGGGFSPDQIVTYKKIGDRELKLDLFYPANWKAGDFRSAALFFFGGGWMNGDTRQFYPHAEYLASRGMVAICAEYRTGSLDGVQPAQCVEDAKSAVRFVRSHASTLGIDPQRLAVGGGSAGGHLAAATATVEGFDAPDDDLTVSPLPNALLLFNPACDNSKEGYGYDRVKDAFPAISPLENLNRKVPPTVIFLGDRDGVFPVPRAKLYQERMQAQGNVCELWIYPDQIHGFFNLDRKKQGFDAGNNKRYFLETGEIMDRFLVAHGLLSGAPTLREWFAAQEATEISKPIEPGS